MKYIDNVYVINLKKDTKRLKDVLKECKKLNKKPIRIDAVYGKDLSTDEIILNTDWVCPQLSAVGCGMSHIKAWEKMIRNGDSSSLFLEDDVVIDDDIVGKLQSTDIPDDYYIIYLGSIIGSDPNKDNDIDYPLLKLYTGGYAKKTVLINEGVYIPALPVALHGYILSRKGVEFLLENIKKDKIKQHIDTQILKYIYKVPSYAVYPQLIQQKDMSVEFSNNTVQFPMSLNKILSLLRDKNNVPTSYKLTVGLHDIKGYTVNAYTFLFIILGLMLGPVKTTTFFGVLGGCEFMLSKTFPVKGIVISYVLSMLFPILLKV